MKFSCEKDVILKEISVAQEVISSKTSMSILSNVYLDVADDTLTIRATDLKVGFETRIPVEVNTPGRTTIFCDKLLGILRSLPAGEVEFEQSDATTFVIRPRFKKIDFQLRSIDADKYPEIQIADDQSYFDVPQADFIEMISQTVFAVSDDETRYFMNGVYMEQTDDGIVMVATDGRRLSHISKNPGEGVPEFQGIIIPPKILQMVKKLASGEGSISLAVGEKNVFCRFENQRISSALIEGQFPNYRRVIPENQSSRLEINRNELLEALKRVSLLVEKSRRIYVTMAENSLTLQSEESEVGHASEELSCSYEGPETRMALNYSYLTEPLRVIETEDIALLFTDSSKALSIESVPKTDYFHIVMPMQLD